MNFDLVKSRHLVTNERSDSKLGFRIVGSAYHHAPEKAYLLYLRIFPGVPYYVVKNWGEFPEYIVFSGREAKPNGGYRYFNRIGSGFIRHSESILEIVLPDLDKTFYIHLEPCDWHMVEQKTAA